MGFLIGMAIGYVVYIIAQWIADVRDRRRR